MHSPELVATCPRESNASQIQSEWRLQEYWNHNWPLLRQAYIHYYHLIAIFASSVGQEGSEIIGALTQDEIFVYGLQFCLLLLFLYLMHLLRSWSNAGVVHEPLPVNIPEVTKELVCEFEFVSEQEKRATQEAAAEAMLELEEKRRRKRFTKKRKCSSAGPILIALRRQSQRPKKRTEVIFEPITHRDRIVLEHHLPPREKPLMVNFPPPPVVVQATTTKTAPAPAAYVEQDDLDLATFVCVIIP